MSEKKQWKSCAEWPPGIVEDNTTTDTHDTEVQAASVCRMLRRDGLGGNGVHFPIKTWVEPVTHPHTKGEKK